MRDEIQTRGLVILPGASWAAFIPHIFILRNPSLHPSWGRILRLRLSSAWHHHMITMRRRHPIGVPVPASHSSTAPPSVIDACAGRAWGYGH